LKLPDLRKLRHVVGVARSGSFTAASNLLGITQSALTKSVAEVEHLLEMTLFERLPRGVQLTEAGKILVDRAERLLADAGELMIDLEEINRLQRGHLNIGVAPAAFVTFLENTVSRFAHVYPGIQIRVRAGTIDEMAGLLINGQVDLCVGAVNYLEAWSELDISLIAGLRYFFIGRQGHPAGDKPTAQELLAYPLILPATGLSTEVQLARAYQAAGLSPRAPHYVCDHLPLITRLISATEAITPLVTFTKPNARFRENFTVFEDVVELDCLSLGFATSKRARQSSQAVSAFRDIFGKFLNEEEPVFV
jgi:DNA-binding transcriptional LysR family regulator